MSYIDNIFKRMDLQALFAHQLVYTEIGMKLGAKMILQLLNTKDCTEFKMTKAEY